MEYIGLIGLIGLLGFLGKSGFTEKIDELKSDITKNTEEVDKRVSNIEKIASAASSKANELHTETQHYATKIDLQDLSKRVDTVAKSADSKKISSLESQIAALQKTSEEVTKNNADLQQGLQNLTAKNFDDALQKISAGVQNLFDKFHTIAENCKTFDENFKVLGTDSKNIHDTVQVLDERVKTLENVPESPTSDDPEQVERLTTLEGEHKDFTQKLEDYNAVLQKHHVALVQWKNNFGTIQNTFNAIQKTFEENKKVFDAVQGRLIEQEKTISDFKEKFDAQATMINSSQANMDEFKAKFDEQAGLIDSSQQTISELEKILVEFKTTFDVQEKVFDEFKAKFDEQDKALASVQQSISKFEEVFESIKEKMYLTIENFDIKTTGRIFFTNKPDEVFQNLKIASNLTGITSFLESSNFEKKENFIRIVENYRQNLKKVSDKVRRHKFNEDALSEEVTDAFFNTLSKFFLATIPISIYRGARQETLDALDDKAHEDEFKFYSTFLMKVNEYLAACQVYTVQILPKNVITSSDIDRMSVTRKETSNEAEDNVIDEVERLPYYMDYMTESGEVENFCSEGKMVVLKFDGGAQ